MHLLNALLLNHFGFLLGAVLPKVFIFMRPMVPYAFRHIHIYDITVMDLMQAQRVSMGEVKLYKSIRRGWVQLVLPLVPQVEGTLLVIIVLLVVLLKIIHVLLHIILIVSKYALFMVIFEQGIWG